MALSQSHSREKMYCDSPFPDYISPKTQLPLKREGDRLYHDEGETFPIILGIPRFVSSEKYTESFGLEWNRFCLTQLDSYTRTTISRDRLKHCFGESLWNNLKGKIILEAGCGAGRFTEILLQQGAYVVSLDLSKAVEANQKNCPQNEQHRIVQADIFEMPFLPHQFDIVLCIGVIQHTPHPEETIKKLGKQVKVGGHLILDHYTYSLYYYTKLAPLLMRPIFKRLSPHRALKATEWLVNVCFPLHQKTKSNRLIQLMLSRILPIRCYYYCFPDLNDELQKEWAVLDTFDFLTDHYKHLRTKGQIVKTLNRMNFKVEYSRYHRSIVEVRGECRQTLFA